jgi:hypothetical protein
VVARPCEARWELADSLFSVRGPFAARGDKGEEEYPYHWLGGIGEFSSINKRELHGARETSTQSE